MSAADRTLEAYGWSERWAALFAETVDARSPAADGAASGGRHPGMTAGPPFEPERSPTDAAPPARPGRIVRHDATAVAVAVAEGVVMRPLRRGLDPQPVVGDWVVERGGTLAAVLPRSSLLERHSVRRQRPQPLAANVDLVLVVCGLDRPVKAGRIRRTATQAWDAGAVPTVVLTKADTLDEIRLAEVVEEVDAGNPGLDVLTTSVETGLGIDQLLGVVTGTTVVLLGESGAGKSSLVNALVGGDGAETGAVRRGDAKGRHTTTNRQLHLIPGGGVVIDTPGIRAVGLWADIDAVATTFDDIEETAATCRFSDCRHGGEPECAVQEAVAQGRLAVERLESWRALEQEAAAAERRADEAERRRERASARVSKEAQRRKGRR